MKSPSDVDLLLAGLDTNARDRLQNWIDTHSYQGISISAQSTWPDRRFWQRRGPEFELGRLASKFGGCPYFEATSEIPKYRSRLYEPLAQFAMSDLAEIDAPMPRNGMLVLWVIREAWTAMPFEVRFYPTPSIAKAAAAPDDLKLDRRREARLTFAAHRLISDPTPEECGEILADQTFDPMLGTPPATVLRERFARLCFSDDDAGNVFLPEDEAWIRARRGDEILQERRALLRLGDDWQANFEVGTCSLYVTADAGALENGQFDGLQCISA